MSAHTPGPWRVEGTKGGGQIISAGVNAYGDGPAEYVCLIFPDLSPVNPADVELICDAPRLKAQNVALMAVARALHEVADRCWVQLIEGLSDADAGALEEAFNCLPGSAQPAEEVSQ